jgi:hypothetical protein
MAVAAQHLDRLSHSPASPAWTIQVLTPPPPFTCNLGYTMIGVGIGRFSGTFNGITYKDVTATVSFKFTDAGEPGTSDTASYVIPLSDGTVVLRNSPW